MKSGRVLFFILLVGYSLQAQVRPPVSLKREGALAPVERVLSASSSDTIRVLALMVNFQQDTDTLTTGNGRFQTDGTAAARLLDPPPHDSAYFAYKLMFLSNYFRKVSNGKVNIKGEVFGKTITLSKKMSAYSPPKDKSNDKPLADLVVESWHTADSLYPAFPFSQYNAFVVFHAGAGRDIDLVSLLGFDPTPNDIPSITFNLKMFREYLKDPSYAGISVSKGAFRITNTMVLPETESRALLVSGVIDTLQLSLNGLLANSFGSYLGLPDLFNTKTGASGIGRFGLMDGGGISAFNGLFPPEPSAWEKVYLGWVTPITVSSGTTTLLLPAVSLTNVGQDTIYKVPINEREYFLIENRSRDPQQNGQRLTILQGNSTITKYFSADTAGFLHTTAADVSAITGSVIDVEDFDWAIPGLLAESEEFKGGGILIWHIDEDVIARGMLDNTVNANPNLRGVDLEEADGSQDVGRTYTSLEAGSGTELGWPLDCWFDGNTAVVYKNLFDNNSNPNSKSNSGARSLITIKNFSKRSARMTATVQIGDEFFTPLSGFPKQLKGEGQNSPLAFDLTGDGQVELVTTRRKYSNGKAAILAWSQNGASVSGDADSSGILTTLDGSGVLNITMFLHPVSKERYIAALGNDPGMDLYLWRLKNVGSLVNAERVFKVPVNGIGVMAVDSFLVVFSGSSGLSIVTLQGTKNELLSNSSPFFEVCRIGQTQKIAAIGIDSLFIIDVRLSKVVKSVRFSGFTQGISSGKLNESGNVQLVTVALDIANSSWPDFRLLVFDETGDLTTTIPLQKFLKKDEVFGFHQVLADVNNDGKKEIILLSSQGRLFVFNEMGFLADGFPTPATSSVPGRHAPVVGDIDGDGKQEIIFLDSSGTLHFIDGGTGAVKLPSLKVSRGSFFSVALFPVNSSGGPQRVGIAFDDFFGKLTALQLQVPYQPNSFQWPMFRYDASRTSFAAIGTPNARSLSSDFLPKARTYNWPNPVYGSTTQIRYYTPEDADISIKILDLAGTKITELKARSTGGVDGEVVWDVSNVQSGVYLARIEATGGGRNAVTIIKIAVVK